MEEHKTKKHNKTLLIYHVVCPIKYRKQVLSEVRASELKKICQEISERYEIEFLEIGADVDHVHFLIKSVPILSISKVVKIIKGITSREMYKRDPSLKAELWGGNFWTSGYYANTVGRYGNMEMLKKYVEQQGQEYEQIYIDKDQLKLF